MPFTQSTELGRKVKLEDWVGFHRDRVLVTLYTLRDAGHEDGLTAAQIADITGLQVVDACMLIAEMREHELVEATIRSTNIITERGIRWVEESPRQP